MVCEVEVALLKGMETSLFCILRHRHLHLHASITPKQSRPAQPDPPSAATRIHSYDSRFTSIIDVLELSPQSANPRRSIEEPEQSPDALNINKS